MANETEVVYDTTTNTSTNQPKQNGMVGFNYASIIGSPFTWLVVGAGVAWWLMRDKKKQSKATHFPPTES